MFLNLGLLQTRRKAAGFTPYFMLVGTDDLSNGYVQGTYGDLIPKRPDGWDFDLTSLAARSDTSEVRATTEGNVYQAGVSTLTVEFESGESVNLTWDGTRYDGVSVEVATLLENNVGEGLDGRFIYEVEAPIILTQPQSVNVPQEGSTVLTVVAEDNTPSGIIGYQWYKNGQPIVGETSASLTVDVSLEITSDNYNVTVYNDSTHSTTSTTATVTVEEINLYVNWQLVGGDLTIGDTAENNPPDDHSIGFNQGDVQSQPIDNGDGTFNWDSNFNNGTGRQYLAYPLTDNNPDLTEGVYEFTFDYFARTTGQQLSTYSTENLQFEVFDDRGIVGQWRRIGAILTVSGVYGSTSAQRVGNGVASAQSRGGIIANPRLVKISELPPVRKLLDSAGEVLTNESGEPIQHDLPTEDDMFLYDYLAQNEHTASSAAPIDLTVTSQPIVALNVPDMSAGEYEVKVSSIFDMDDKDDQIHLVYSGNTVGTTEVVDFATDKQSGATKPVTYVFPYTHAGGLFTLNLDAFQTVQGGNADLTILISHIVVTRTG